MILYNLSCGDISKYDTIKTMPAIRAFEWMEIGLTTQDLREKIHGQH